MRLFKRQLQLRFDIFTTLSSSGASSSSGGATKHFFKDVEAGAARSAAPHPTNVKTAEAEATLLGTSPGARAFPARRRPAASLLHGFPVFTILIKELAVLRIRKRVVRL